MATVQVTSLLAASIGGAAGYAYYVFLGCDSG